MESLRVDDSGRTPLLRASDADRERVVATLRRHYADGRLSDEELSERVESAYRTATVGELEALTADLPSAPRPAGPKRRRRRGGAYAASVRIHATFYVLVNVMLIAIWAAAGGGYFWPIWPILGWGIGLGSHAAPLIAGVGSRSSRPRLPETTRTPVEDVASSVASERPSLTPGAAPDGTVTILFSDIEGSSALNERLGDVEWFELLGEHNRIVREQVGSCDGFEVKSQGDGFMIAFPSARRAIECARGIQAAVEERFGEGPIRVRIGLHTGEAIRQDADFYGKNVVIAARIAAQARGGEIVVSSVVRQLVESAGDIAFDDGSDVELAGLSGTHRVYRVLPHAGQT